MERDVIRQQIREIPLSTLGEVQQDHEIWEFNDDGAHCKVTRHKLPLENADQGMVSLSVSGATPERDRVIREFSEVLGSPAAQEMLPGDEGQPIDFVVWLLA